MRRSSSTSSTWGASSAGCAGGLAAAIIALGFMPCSLSGVAQSRLGRLAAAEDGLQHLIGILAIDHRAQELAHGLGAGRADVGNRTVDAVGLQPRQLAHQRLALGGGVEQPLPAVVIAGLLDDVALVEKLLEHAPQRLLGDAQDVEEIGDLQPGIAVDEMQHPVMGPAEAERLELMVGIAHEVAVGEEQELNDIPAQIARTGAAGGGLGAPRIGL